MPEQSDNRITAEELDEIFGGPSMPIEAAVYLFGTPSHPVPADRTPDEARAALRGFAVSHQDDHLTRLREEIEMAAGSSGFISDAAVHQIVRICREHGEQIKQALQSKKAREFPKG